MCRFLVYTVCCLCLLSCSRNKERESCLIYFNTDVQRNSESKVNLIDGNKIILEYYHLLDDPKVYDDNFWQKIYIIISDSSNIKKEKEYNLINNNDFEIITQYGGAWQEVEEYEKLEGKLKFSKISKNEISIKITDTIKGYYTKNNNVLFVRPIVFGKIIYTPAPPRNSQQH